MDTLELKKLNAAHIAAEEYDYCPDSSEAENVMDLFEIDIPIESLREALDENQGRRPDEIQNSISDAIKNLK